MRGVSWVISCALTLAACGDPGPKEASSASVAFRTAQERAQLARKVEAGDTEAAFELWTHYAFAGGDELGRLSAKEEAEKRHWLEKAASLGHESARFNLAVESAAEDCGRARRMMQDVIHRTSDESTRQSAASWLQDQRFKCS